MNDDTPTTSSDPEAKPEEKEEKKTPLSAFLAASGYKASDVLSHNDRTRAFVTSNGGKYQLTKAGKVRRILGPAYPKEVVEA